MMYSSRWLVRHTSVCALSLLVLQLGCRPPFAQRNSSNAARNTMTQTASTCAGRFSLQLPAPFEQGMNPQIFNGLRLRWDPVEAEGVEKTWKEHVEKLRTEQGPSPQGSRIVKNYLLEGRHAVFYRYVPTPNSSHTLETWTLYGDKILQTEVDDSRDQFKVVEDVTLNVLRHFVPSSSGQPVGDGFCIQNGSIQLLPDQGEQIAAIWGLPLDYELELRTAVVTRPNTLTYIEDAHKDELQSAVTPGSHYTLTRAVHRTVLGMEGQETIQHFHNDPSPTKFYNAVFSFAGVKDKGSQPGWRITLSAYDRPDQKVDEAKFIATWEQILQGLSVRLRD